MGRVSSVGIATGCGLDGPEIESPKIAGSLPTEAVGFFVKEKSTARSTIGRERTIEHKRTCNEQIGGKKIPGRGEIFRTRPDRPWGPPSLLYNEYQVFPGSKAAGAWC
jgi:hypothetical protein